jgi:hypothetical protein
MIKAQSTGFFMLALSAAALIAGGCDDPDHVDVIAEIDDDARDNYLGPDSLENGLEIGSEPLATVSGWTRYTSEEYPPINCEQTSMVNGIGCSGRYCDNVRMHCSPTGLAGGSASWSSYFSEETGGAGNRRMCGERQWLVGLACSGRYCDNLSIQCRQFPASNPTSCYWTGWISEEGGGTLWFGQGYYARGMECHGDYCDNKRLWVCRP